MTLPDNSGLCRPQMLVAGLLLALAGTGCGWTMHAHPMERAAAPGPGLHQLPTLFLERRPEAPTGLREDRLPRGWHLQPGPAGRLLASDGTIILRGSPQRPLMDVQSAPGSDELLVNLGPGRYAIHTAQGEWIGDVPEVPRADDASQVAWRWKDAHTLVGVAEVSFARAHPDGTGGDAVPEAILLFLHQPYERYAPVYLLVLQQPPGDTLIRLEGLTANGGLLLATVAPDEYANGPPTAVLGVFDVP